MRKKLVTILSGIVGILWYLSIGLSGSSCAQIVSPSGGERDTIPPVMDSLLSSPNEQIRFEKQALSFTFDEFLNLSNPNEQIIVTPPLDYPFETELKKFKTLIFQFNEKETLKENVTYSINFGEAIKDFTEGNAFEYSYVFSTGDYIDSLEFKGTITDAFTNEPVEKALVLLYSNTQDSVVRSEKPFYFARTNKQGIFQLRNLRSDTFKLAALVDKNVNYLFDLESEFIGFADSLVIISADSNAQETANLQIFQETPSLKIVEKSLKSKGQAEIQFNQNIEELSILANRFDEFIYQYESDKLLMWYTQLPDSSGQLILQHPDLQDTFYLETSAKDFDMDKHVLKKPKSNMASSRLLPDTDLILSFEQPVFPTDSFTMQVFVDTIMIDSIDVAGIDSIDPRNIIIELEPDTFKQKRIILLPGSIGNLHGRSQDTLLLKYAYAKENELSGLAVSVNGLDSTTIYQAILMLGDSEIKQFTIEKNTTFTDIIKPLFPGEYELILYEDRNENGKWDTGNYDEKRQAEKRRIFELDKLRANWEVESIITWE